MLTNEDWRILKTDDVVYVAYRTFQKMDVFKTTIKRISKAQITLHRVPGLYHETFNRSVSEYIFRAEDEAFKFAIKCLAEDKAKYKDLIEKCDENTKQLKEEFKKRGL